MTLLDRSTGGAVGDMIRMRLRRRRLLVAGRERPAMVYRGVLHVLAPWGRYSRAAGPWRVSRADAVRDAVRAREDWAAVGRLPE